MLRVSLRRMENGSIAVTVWIGEIALIKRTVWLTDSEPVELEMDAG